MNTSASYEENITEEYTTKKHKKKGLPVDYYTQDMFYDYNVVKSTEDLSNKIG